MECTRFARNTGFDDRLTIVMQNAHSSFEISQDAPIPLRHEDVSVRKSDSLLGDDLLQEMRYRWVSSTSSAHNPNIAAARASIRTMAQKMRQRLQAVALNETTRREMKWLSENRVQYSNRWVALDGDRLLAVGDSAREVFDAIRDFPGTPLVTKVEPAGQTPFGGW